MILPDQPEITKPVTVTLAPEIINDLKIIERCDADVWHSKGCTSVKATVQSILGLL